MWKPEDDFHESVLSSMVDCRDGTGFSRLIRQVLLPAELSCWPTSVF